MTYRDYHLNFTTLSNRSATDLIIIHHTGSGSDVDANAQSIHAFHRDHNGWAGIGYHFVIRKDGTIELGRPEWAVGSHAHGFNSHSIGIHLSGDFDCAQPTEAQLAACGELIRELCAKYSIPIDRKHIVGHREVNVGETGCPGKNLFPKLADIVQLAQNHQPDDINQIFADAFFHLDQHCASLQAVIKILAAEHGIYGALDILQHANTYGNLSYVDSEFFDDQLLDNIYQHLLTNRSK